MCYCVVVFVIECGDDKFLLVWGLGKVNITTESERIGNRARGTKSRMPRARGELPGPETRGEGRRPGAWKIRVGASGRGVRGQGQEARGQGPESEVSCLNDWMTH